MITRMQNPKQEINQDAQIKHGLLKYLSIPRIKYIKNKYFVIDSIQLKHLDHLLRLSRVFLDVTGTKSSFFDV